MRMSKGFRSRWETERLSELLPEIAVQPRLRALVQAPFVHGGGTLVLEPLLAHATGRESFQDATGYEAFINKIHVEDLIENSGTGHPERFRILIQQGTKAAIDLSERLKTEGNYRVLLSLDADLPTMTLRFFGRRKGEQWGAEDPDAYQLEEVLMIDTES